MRKVIEVTNLSKEYKLGTVGRGTLYRDLQSLWARIRNKDDPNSIIGKSDISSFEKKSFLALNSVNLDINEEVGPDILHDLNVFPYPLNDNEFDEIHLNNVLFQLNDVFLVMKEIHRIVKLNGKVIIKCAYFRSNYAYHYPGSKNNFTVSSFSFFDPDHIFYKKFKYTKIKFKTEKISFNDNFNSGILKKILILFANKFPHIYENNFSQILPLDEIKYELKKIIT